MTWSLKLVGFPPLKSDLAVSGRQGVVGVDVKREPLGQRRAGAGAGAGRSAAGPQPRRPPRRRKPGARRRGRAVRVAA